MVIMKNPQRSPFTSQYQFRKTITIQIAPDGAANHADILQQSRVGLVEHEGAILAVENPRTDGLRVLSGLNPSADKQIQVAVSVQVPQCQRTDTCLGGWYQI